uniref:Integrase, catalytic region, zinc finger, CCHC-type, peptidase aspartic, catalytic n=1 Tax=Tanacetum cinerariifolium TaxID=118510 RepID=A0A699HZP1_TANCI|nr:hypothetical protein [Tanacetum cinerariifolium]
MVIKSLLISRNPSTTGHNNQNFIPLVMSMENVDLKIKIQDKVFVITSLKNDLRKLKGKEVENASQIPIATTITPGMFKLDLDPLAPKLLQNREAHIYYLKHTKEQANILQGIFKQAKAKQPFNNSLDLAYKHAARIHESLVYVRDTCPNSIKLSEKKVVITPMNKVKKVRFSKPLTSSSNIKQGSTLSWRFIRIVHYASGLSFLTAVCLIRQRFVSSGLPTFPSSSLVLPAVYRFLKTNSHSDFGNKPLPVSFLGLPMDIYKLINRNTNAKDIWDNVKMLLEGSELNKDDRESQLYDEFEHFGKYKGENIHDYYIRFTKLINDMRHIKMTMPKIQLNSKFVNNMLPEWGRFVTTVKLNRGLKESNHDQLYAYLKHHESHANENKMLMERFNQHSHDPLTLVSNALPYQYPSSSSIPPQSSYIPPVTYQPQFTNNTQLDTGFSPTDELLDNLTKQVALLAQQYKT